jgi:hypothetical protein
MNKHQAVFTPHDEPYLGRESVYHFDQMILCCLEANWEAAAFSRSNANSLSELQHAGCQLIPHGVSLALSTRELVRQGYLLGALVLLRPLIERAAIISYLCEQPEAIHLWRDGWKHGKRPSLATMLSTMSEKVDVAAAQELCNRFNHILHGDPAGASHGIITLDDGTPGFSPSKQLNNPSLCDDICFHALSFLIVLTARMAQIFPRNAPEAQGQCGCNSRDKS